MSLIEDLLAEYKRHVSAPWQNGLAGQQRVWFAIYEPTQERRLRFRLSDFEAATLQAGHGWRHLDLTDTFATWMAANEYRESYFDEPELMTYALNDYAATVIQQVGDALDAPGVDDETVVAISGLASLFGFTHVSTTVDAVSGRIKGRLLAFFPGDHDEQNHFRLLDARDGWNYLAVPIKARR
jgi:hypothetical protein